ncbi:MAG: hypothetical protein D8M58_14370 [Calditrichaeota bacterium]|nr:MAG: hypothetical protein DWQ03_15610 [Calditrichota bacterium]MBL1206586.1 hypothetical protein [Calditrichota bacterium]NOG46413.1 hypothetical protein [Calditrichota bacterium]
MYVKLAIIVLFSGLLLFCTENPFFEESIKFKERQEINGKVQLQFSSDNSDILVYFEGFEYVTKTDKDGNFALKIPPAHLQPGNGLTGLYKIYYYVANYKIESSTVLVSNGEFVYDFADLDLKGQVKRGIVLNKLLDVSTEVDPVSIEHSYNGQLNIGVTLNVLVDSVIVSSFLIKKKELGGVYLSSAEQVHLIKSGFAILTKLTLKGKTSLPMKINWKKEKEAIPVGNYDVIPYLQIHQEGIPAKLLKIIGTKSHTFHSDFLNIPYRRATEQIIISSSK